MSPRFFSLQIWLAIGLIAALLGLATLSIEAADQVAKKIKIQLVWGTNDDAPSGKKYKPLDAEAAKKLGMFKWKKYFLVSEKTVTLAPNVAKRERLSDHCEIELKDVGHSNIEVDLFGKGKHVMKKTQKLPKDDTLAIAGDDKNDNAWFILIQEVE